MYYVQDSFKERFKQNIKIYNNTVYYAKDSILIDWNYIAVKNLDYLYNEYNIEKNSKAQLQSSEQLEKLDNDYIRNSNDYTKIKTYLENIQVNITYSNTSLTNQNVIATLNCIEPLVVNNNSHKNTYEFTENGTFTFEYTKEGKPYTMTASVNNIDKTLPVITILEQNKLYIDRVRPIISDENLDNVTLYLNTYLVEDYVINSEISGEGFYKIVATDKAGNETSVEFGIMEKTNKEYKIEENYILNIENNTLKSNFDSKLNFPIEYEIKRGKKVIAKESRIATGDILETKGGAKYTLIVNGDINRDGDVNIKDVIKLRKFLLERNNFDKLALMAADCNLDGKSISIKDLIRMRLILLARKTN